MKAVFCSRGAAGWESFWSGISKPLVAGWWWGHTWSCLFHRWSSHPEKRNVFGGGLRSHLPQCTALPLPPVCPAQAVSVSSHPSGCELPRAEGFCPSGLYSTIVCLPPSTYPLISSLKKVKFAQTWKLTFSGSRSNIFSSLSELLGPE